MINRERNTFYMRHPSWFYSEQVRGFVGVYEQPHYYEIAFSYQDVRRQIDFFEDLAKKYSNVPVKRFLDICCGPSPQLREIAERGYEAVGLDVSERMLDYLKSKSQQEDLKIETVEGDMNDFELKVKCDFAFLLSGSVFVDSNMQFLQHLNCVANALKKGGIYLLENFPLGLQPSRREEWKSSKGDIEVKTVYETNVEDELQELYEDRITLEVKDHGEKKTYSSTYHTKNFAPQELQLIIELNGRFGFIGWFKHLKLDPLTKISNDNVVILRKEL